jgi:hypothetical protein
MEKAQVQYYLSLLSELDAMSTQVNQWEAQFLENVLERAERYGEQIRLTDKQCDVIEQMKEKYLQ